MQAPDEPLNKLTTPNRVVGHVASQKPRMPGASGRLEPITQTGRGHDGGKTSTGQSGDDYGGGQPDWPGACDGRGPGTRRGACGAPRPQRLLGGTKRD